MAANFDGLLTSKRFDVLGNSARVRESMSSSTVPAPSAQRSPRCDTHPVVRLAIGALRRGRGVRAGGEDSAHVRRLAGVPDETLPPVVVRQGTMEVVDGLHRWHAAQLRGASHIAATLLDADDLGAFAFALRANNGHDGLPLTRADLDAAAGHVVLQRPQWSDRRIAELTGVPARTIAEARARLDGHTEARIGRDGRTRPTDGARRRALVRELLLDQPHLSLREAGRAAGVSPETVRAVRAGLRAEDRLPARPRTGLVTPPLDGATLVRWLRGDPALRSSQRGRALLRLLHLEAELHASWTDLTPDVPPHCRGGLAAFARQNAVRWRSLAELCERDPAS